VKSCRALGIRLARDGSGKTSQRAGDGPHIVIDCASGCEHILRPDQIACCLTGIKILEATSLAR
jgi:hypothetical protein